MERKNDVASSHQAATDSSCFEVRQSHSYNIHKRCVGGEQFHALFPATNGQRHHVNQDADAYQIEVLSTQPPPRPLPVHQPGHDDIDLAIQNKTEEGVHAQVGMGHGVMREVGSHVEAAQGFHGTL